MDEAKIMLVESGYQLRLFGPKFPSHGALVVTLQIHKDGRVDLNWLIAGPQPWPEAKVLMQGLLDLTVIADELHSKWERKIHGKSKD